MLDSGRTLLMLATAVCAALVSIAGCAHQSLEPQTGDLSFRLLWNGDADLDLHVVDPQGRHTGIVMLGRERPPEELAALKRLYEAEQRGEKLAPGGVLDIDCNAGPDRMCRRPIENIFWQPGTAPRGAYRFWVLLFRTPVGGGEVPFTLEVRRGETVVESHRGSLEQRDEESTHLEFVY